MRPVIIMLQWGCSKRESYKKNHSHVKHPYPTVLDPCTIKADPYLEIILLTLFTCSIPNDSLLC